MKKVRMVAGVALPAAAALTAAGPALTAAAPAQAAVTRANAPLLTCPTTYSANDTSAFGWWTGQVWGANHCAGFQRAELWYAQTGVTERVRYRNAQEGLLYAQRNGGTISAGATWFWSNHQIDAYYIWQGAVWNGTSTILTPSGGSALVHEIVP